MKRACPRPDSRRCKLPKENAVRMAEDPLASALMAELLKRKRTDESRGMYFACFRQSHSLLGMAQSNPMTTMMYLLSPTRPKTIVKSATSD
jgi:hypothetical protein